MSQTLSDFRAWLRIDQSCALNALLKIADAKHAILEWKQEVASTHAKASHEKALKSIAVEHALALVDNAEESILDAFRLQQNE